jgi:hypothetical protein
MNLFPLLRQLAAATASAEPTARRAALTQLARAAATTLPVALGTLVAQPAAAQRTGTALDGLFAMLQMAWLNDEFYSRVLGQTAVTPPVASTLVPAAIQPDLALIRTHHRQQITLIEDVIRKSGGVVAARPQYDFTGSANGSRPALFPNVFRSTDDMLGVAQSLADAAVRTSIGQVPLLISSNDYVDLGASILAVQGRHAAHLRILRQQRSAAVKPWISGTDGGGPLAPATAPIYAGENTVLQNTTNTQLRDTTTLLPENPVLTDAEKTAAATEAFDEPFTPAAAQAVVALFTV